jgi:hypothetical protein
MLDNADPTKYFPHHKMPDAYVNSGPFQVDMLSNQSMSEDELDHLPGNKRIILKCVANLASGNRTTQ